MTDPYNTAPFEDRQSKQITNAQELGDKIDLSLKARRENTNPNTSNRIAGGKSNKDSTNKRTKLYSLGIEHFSNFGIFPVLDRNAPHCGHQIFVTKKPPEVKGVNYDPSFLPKIPIFDQEDFNRVESALSSLPNADSKEFWQPLVEPKNDSELFRFVERLISMEKTRNNFSAQTPKRYGLTHDPSNKGVFGKLAENPISWIPAREWFSETIRNNLRFEDVFTIFPQAEIDIIKLWLGRVAVGPSNHIPDNHDTPIRHTARMGLVIVGKVFAHYKFC